MDHHDVGPTFIFLSCIVLSICITCLFFIPIYTAIGIVYLTGNLWGWCAAPALWIAIFYSKRDVWL